MKPQVAWVIGAGALCACAGHLDPQDFLLPPPAEDPDTPTAAARHSLHPQTGEVIARWTALVWPDGRVVKHGREERFHPDGAPRALRHYDRGRPSAQWRSWYPDGTLRSEYFHDPDGDVTPMRFFHPSGAPSAEGPASRGLREGGWSFWYPDGRLRQEGAYRGGHRHGVWSLRWENGGLRSRGRYVDDRRVGEWRHWPADPPTPTSDWWPPVPPAGS